MKFVSLLSAAVVAFVLMQGTFSANGTVSGAGAPKDRKRTFIFKGTAKDGVITFKHSETTGGKTVATGEGNLHGA